MADTAIPPRRNRGRSAFSIIFGILGVLGVLVSVVAIWANQVLFDSDSVGNAVEQTLLEPEVTDALAVFLTDQVLEAVDINELVAEKLPDDLTALSPVIAGGARTVVQEAFERVLANDSTRAVIVAASERAHDRVMQVLEGGSLTDGANVENGEVSLNLLAIIGNGLQSLQDAGLLTRVDLPEFDTSADPADQIKQLEDATGRDLPDDFGQIVVYESEQIAAAQEAVARAQQALVLFRRAIIAILVLTVVSLVASVLLAMRRRRSLVIVSLGVVAAMALGRAVVRTVVQEVPTLALKPGSRAALRSMVESLASGLMTAVTLALIAGLAVSAIAFLTGSSQGAVALRGRVSATGASLSSVVADHRDGVALAAFALAVIVIAAYGFTAVPLLVASLLAVGGAAALLFLPASAADQP
jgi:hypothetical protein